MKLNAWFGMIFIYLLMACSTAQTVVTETTIFKGENDNWDVQYIYDPVLYEEKKINWFEIEWKGEPLSEKEIHEIEVQIKPPDNILVGTIGDMKTNIDGNTIQFLVGTMNHDTYKEDVYKITIFCKGEKDVIKLRYE